MASSKAGRSVAAWEEEGRMLRRRAEVAYWALGDWLIAGVAMDADPGFRRSMRITGYSQSFLYHLRQTAEAFPVETRSMNLAWSAHRTLLREPDVARRMEIHARAVKEGWNTGDMDRHFLQQPSTAVARKTTRVARHVEVICPHCRAQFPIHGNKASGTTKERGGGHGGDTNAADEGDDGAAPAHRAIA